MKVDYQKTFIYKLCCKDINVKDIYVGHTTDYKSRKKNHKTCCNNPNNKKHNQYKYQFIRDNGCYDNWDMIIIKTYPCNNKREAEAEENRIMIELGSTLNSNKSYITEEQKKEDRKEYYELNKEELNKKMKEYREKNKEILSEKSKQYYQENKNEKEKKMKVKVKCEYCNCEIRKDSLRKHQKSQKCIKIQNDTFKN